jgi:hypothetical protein
MLFLRARSKQFHTRASLSNTISCLVLLSLVACGRGDPGAAQGDLLEFKSLSAGITSACGIAVDSKTYCWGAVGTGPFGDDATTGSGAGVLGDGLVFGSSDPHLVGLPEPLSVVSVGFGATCGVSESSNLYCWGFNGSGQAGSGDYNNSLTPRKVNFHNASMRDVSVGQFSTCGLTLQGNAFCWGANADGQLGYGSRQGIDVPGAVKGGHEYSKLVVGQGSTCAIDSHGSVFCWGEVNDHSGADPTLPSAVKSTKPFIDISVGRGFACGLTRQGAAYCWGSNEQYELGNSKTAPSDTPKLVQTSSVFRTLASSSYWSCGVTSDSRLLCWGLIPNNVRSSNAPAHLAEHPESVMTSNRFVDVSIADTYLCALGPQLNAMCWGDGKSGVIQQWNALHGSLIKSDDRATSNGRRR